MHLNEKDTHLRFVNSLFFAGHSKKRQRQLVLIATTLLLGGCQSLRFAPTEAQKQNTYLHHRTTQAAAMKAQDENSSQTMRQLTTHAARQSEAILAYYGLPREIPPSETIEQILQPDNEQISRTARADALQRPDPWDVADNLLELGVAIAGVVGGVYGTRAIAALRLARHKSTALREIITGNELFKTSNTDHVTAFKQAHQRQSTTTRSIVATMKQSPS